MSSKVKLFLKTNMLTKNLYAFLFYCRYYGLNRAIDKAKVKLGLSNTQPTEVPIKEITPSKTKALVKNNIANDNLYWFIYGIWNTAGATDELLHTLETISQCRYSWKNYNNRIFLIYICCLLEHNKKEHAIQILEKYLYIFKKKEIEIYLPVAKLFIDEGYEDFLIQKSATIFHQLELNRCENILTNYLDGKKVAVVGNGGNELEKKQGTKIDSYDVVIRFNNYPNNYIADYGEKTNIWVRNSARETKDRDNIEDLQLILWESDFWHIHVQFNHLDLLYRDIKICPNKVLYLYNIRKELVNASSILNPTTGAQVIYLLTKYRHILQKLDCFGFSFISEMIPSNYDHYYDNTSTAIKIHNIDAEVDFLQKIYNPKKEKKTGVVVKLNKGKKYCIFACAFREYNIKKGKTGGPAGVLAMQREILGSKYKDFDITYLFLPEKFPYSSDTINKCKDMHAKVRDIYYGADFIQNNKTILKSVQDEKIPLLICHELGTAYGAFLCGYKYMLVYHQQGSLINEMNSINQPPSEQERIQLNRVEKIVFQNAEKVFFPSLGAQQMLLDTSENLIHMNNVNFSSTALYNSIPNYNQNAINRILLDKLNIPKIDKERFDVFLSIGDFNYDKGMDLVPQLLNKITTQHKKEILWIAIGSASDQNIFTTLEQSKKFWNIKSILVGSRTDHDTLLALIEESDYYIMLHRKSIFDLAILEAMRASKPLILSNVGGNPEFNVCDNVLLVENDDLDNAQIEFSKREFTSWSQKNKKAFQQYFSNKVFKCNYCKAMDYLLNKVNIDS